MRRAVFSFSIFVFGGLAVGASACSSSSAPVGHDGADANNGDTGAVSCGTTTCGQGGLCCAGTDLYCTPTCTRVTSCPLRDLPCKIPPDAGEPADSGSEIAAH